MELIIVVMDRMKAIAQNVKKIMTQNVNLVNLCVSKTKHAYLSIKYAMVKRIVVTELMNWIVNMVNFSLSKVLPRCGQGMFECLNQKCIRSTNVCDGSNDCGDYSDEQDCEDKQCADYGAYCDDGTCLYPHQMCDNVYHCKDFSDERACIFGYY
ncbi:Low-density lipoprotein receptor-related protein 4 [Thelohanellus kitauei]|uniref:Low-density lipoprotein receptor-related protein 4 n=1 Tax=Thelohanellus kitauei TaxID=669202 RepID=A0A0C2N1Q4_THEKT|nr:Low-density lipoprotein receptor-related protein 4 [Thelohanellus kitauei]